MVDLLICPFCVIIIGQLLKVLTIVLVKLLKYTQIERKNVDV